MTYVTSNYIAVFDKWDDQKLFFCFTPEDAQRLSDFHPFAKKHVDEIVEALYAHLLKFEEARMFLDDAETLRRLKIAQRKYFLELTSGSYGEDYYDNRIKVGVTHQRMGIPPRLYMGAYSYYLQLMIPLIYQHLGDDIEKANSTFSAMYKIINLDQELAMSAYIHAVEDVISKQTEEILEMSTPVIQVWEGVVATPIIGTLDSQRAQQFMEHLLEKIVETKSPIALIDITGVPQIDTATAQHLIDTINAVKLLGSKVIITGIRPAIAQTLVHLGINLQGIITKPSMSAGLKVALEMLAVGNAGFNKLI
ncbi:MAG: protoglobin domain-containing protein [Methylovulum sp.]|nr:protoglobin domain-containing protein [Methylovulum sp.]